MASEEVLLKALTNSNNSSSSIINPSYQKDQEGITQILQSLISEELEKLISTFSLSLTEDEEEMNWNYICYSTKTRSFSQEDFLLKKHFCCVERETGNNGKCESTNFRPKKREYKKEKVENTIGGCNKISSESEEMHTTNYCVEQGDHMAQHDLII